jgi:hypothetical protein
VSCKGAPFSVRPVASPRRCSIAQSSDAKLLRLTWNRGKGNQRRATAPLSLRLRDLVPVCVWTVETGPCLGGRERGGCSALAWVQWFTRDGLGQETGRKTATLTVKRRPGTAPAWLDLTRSQAPAARATAAGICSTGQKKFKFFSPKNRKLT